MCLVWSADLIEISSFTSCKSKLIMRCTVIWWRLGPQQGWQSDSQCCHKQPAVMSARCIQGGAGSNTRIFPKVTTFLLLFFPVPKHDLGSICDCVSLYFHLLQLLPQGLGDISSSPFVENSLQSYVFLKLSLAFLPRFEFCYSSLLSWFTKDAPWSALNNGFRI